MRGGAIYSGGVRGPEPLAGYGVLERHLGGDGAAQPPIRLRLRHRWGGRHAFGWIVGTMAACRLSGPSRAACSGHRGSVVSRLRAQARRCRGAGRASSAMNELDSLREQIRRHEMEIAGLHQELVETNKGVVALYAELDQ